jgi:hypothetical protein
MSKELQGKHYDDLGVSRGILATSSGDDEKIAHSILEDAKKKNLDIKIKKNDLGEYEVFKDNESKGVINKQGMSRQDALNIVRDPTNLLMFVPGFNVLGGVAKSASFGSKLIKGAKTAGKLFGAETLANLGIKAGANVESNNVKDGVINTDDVESSLINGAIAPVASVVGELGVRGALKVLPKKVVKKVDEGEEILLTPAQKSKDIKDLAYEEDLRKGLKGDKAKAIMDEFIVKQKKSILDKYNSKYGVEFLDVNNSNAKAGKILDDILYNKNAMQKEIEAGYSELKPRYSEFGYNQEQLSSFIDYLKGNLMKDRNKPWGEITDEVKTLGKDHPLHESYNTINKLEEFLIDKPKNLEEVKNLDELLKSKGGELKNFAKSRDGNFLNMNYGDKNAGAKHFVEKHGNFITNDIPELFKDAELKPADRGAFKIDLPNNMTAFVKNIDGKMKISTIYKNKEGSGVDLPLGTTSNQTRELPKKVVLDDTSRLSADRNSTTENILPKNEGDVKRNFLAPEKFDIENYPNKEGFKSYNDFEVARQLVNKKLTDLEIKGKAKTPEFRMLSILKNSFNEFEDSALNKQKLAVGMIEPKMMGNKKDLEELSRLRQLNAEYNKKFENTKILNELENDELRSYGADFLKNVVNNPEKAGEDLVKLFEGVDSAKQAGVINKVREIFLDKYDKDLKQIFLNSIFTDRHRVGGNADFNVVEANKKLVDKVLKNNKIAKMLFKDAELNDLIKESSVIDGLTKSKLFSQNPSGTSFNLIQNGVFDNSSLFNMVKKYSLDKILENREASRLKKYLGGYMESEAIAPNKNIINGINSLIYGGASEGVKE